VLSIHGGPHSAYGAEWSFPFQLLAARGYAVLYTNPRGSTGYGEDFLWTPRNTLHRYREELRFWDEYLAAPRGSSTRQPLARLHRNRRNDSGGAAR
jgi:hypothetical protein